MEALLKLTKLDDSFVLIGVESVIDIKEFIIKHNDKPHELCTKIQSRGGMVETNYVRESPSKIFEMYKNRDI